MRRSAKPWSILSSLLLVLCLSVGLGLSQAQAKKDAKPGAEEVDHVSLAAMLARDGHDDRAKLELSKVDPSKPGVDLKLYHSLSGLLALKAQAYEQAIDHFERAMQAGQTDDMVFVYLAQAYFGLKDWDRVILSVKNADETGRKFPELTLMRAQAEWSKGRVDQAWRVLDRGRSDHPDHPELLRQQTFALVELGLYQAAVEAGQTYMAKLRDKAQASDYVALALAFGRAGQPEQARLFLERGRLSFPDDLELTQHLAHSYREAGMPLAAAEIMQLGSEQHPELMLDAAELYRQGRAPSRALYMNAQVNDQAQKFKQRASILLDAQRFEEVAALSSRLERLGLFEEQSILYAMAYAKFKVGDFAQAEALIKRISDPTLFEYATQLRRMIARCEQDPIYCGG